MQHDFLELISLFEISELDFIETSIDDLPKGKSLLNMVEWAKEKRYLPPELTASPGKYDWTKAPHLIEPALELSPTSATRQVIVCKGVQIGATTGLIENFIGFTIDSDPCGMLYAREEKEAAELAMELQVARMLEHSELEDKILSNQREGKAGKKTGDRKLFKQFPGGFLLAIGVLNPKKARSNPVRKLLRDEIDAWPLETNEGDPLTLTEKRTITFRHTKKICDISTPLSAQTSRIYKLLLESDFNKRFVPCPFCGEYQELVWYDEENDTGFRYETDDDYILIPGSTHYRCRYCEKGKKHGITEPYKHKIMNAGEYRPSQKTKRLLTKGYHIPSWYSLFESWDEIAADWIAAQKDKSLLRTFKNLRMAIPFEEVELSPKPEMLKGKQRDYLPWIVPNDIAIKDGNGPILLLTCSVDVHKKKKTSEGRLDVEILGHCRNGSTYSILWQRLEGDTEAYWFREYSAAYQADPEALKENTWYRLEHDILAKQFVADNGKTVYPIRLTGVDMGYEPYMVQTFCKQFEFGVIPIWGFDKFKDLAATFKEKKGDHGIYFQIIVDRYKDRLADQMALKWAGHPMPQPSGYMNYPYGDPYNKEYFDMYGGENKINVYDERTGRFLGTRWTRKYSKVPNHAWDCRVYNMALLDIFVYLTCQAMNIQGLDYKTVFDALEQDIAK